MNRPATILGISRSTVYYRPQGSVEADLTIIARLEINCASEYLFAGARMLRNLLRQ